MTGSGCPGNRETAAAGGWLYVLAGKLEYERGRDEHRAWLDERDWPSLLTALTASLPVLPPSPHTPESLAALDDYYRHNPEQMT